MTNFCPMCATAPTSAPFAIMLLWKNAPRLLSLPNNANARSQIARLEVGMGLATLNVWIHDQHDPCRISDLPWRIAVTYCNGNPVEWCGHTYSTEEAKCGHAEFTLPPGCYIVSGLQGIELQLPCKPPVFFPLFVAERAIVIVSCDQTACVHLYATTFWYWFYGARRVARSLAESGKLPADKVERFVAATDDLLKDVPQTAVDAAHERLVEHITEYFQKNPPK